VHAINRDPLKQALSATALIVGGLVPSHIGFNEARQAATQNWLWAVGDSPLAQTSHGIHFNEFQLDVVQRNYIAHALDTSVARSNQVFAMLFDVKTSTYFDAARDKQL